jgi:DNA-binding LacI/PurR family transcriptional regulator
VRRLFRSDLVVMLNGRHDHASPAVIPDEFAGIEQAVADAAAKGVKSAALLSGRKSSLVEQARVGFYRKALARHRIKLLRTIQGDYSYESGHAAAAELIRRPAPDAVFCTSDAMAMGVLDFCRNVFPGNRPTRFRLYGFDNLSLTDFDAYPISSIGYDKEVYVDRILKLLTEPGAFAKGQKPITVPTRYVPRLTA